MKDFKLLTLILIASLLLYSCAIMTNIGAKEAVYPIIYMAGPFDVDYPQGEKVVTYLVFHSDTTLSLFSCYNLNENYIKQNYSDYVEDTMVYKMDPLCQTTYIFDRITAGVKYTYYIDTGGDQRQLDVFCDNNDTVSTGSSRYTEIVFKYVR